MRFEEWEPVYEAVLSDLGFDRAADERARDVLAELAGPFDLGELEAELAGRSVAVAGGAPTLVDELEAAAGADAVVAASGAADVCRERGVPVDLVVTDLDGTPATALALAEAGVPVAVHAHGDNLRAVREWVPRFPRDRVLATTQARPRPPVRNFGGFTDGDRAAFLADHLGADWLGFPGWLFDDPSVSTAKARKLAWAERLLHWLERRRGERFALLDGRRERIDASALPV